MDISQLEFKTEPAKLRDFHLMSQLGDSSQMAHAFIELMHRREVTGRWAEGELWELSQDELAEISERMRNGFEASLPKKKSFFESLFGKKNDSETPAS